MTEISEKDEGSLGGKLARADYVQKRLRPRCRDPDYLILSDLLSVVTQFAGEVKGAVFDYGCGGAPYQALFSHCDRYVGADVTPGPSVDRMLTADGMTQEASESFDAVLSSQVLEHVKEPEEYLRECLRILKPGGELLLSTHGMFHEHGCPHDFYRWTPNGLGAEIASAGFTIVEAYKITTSIRAGLQLKHYFVDRLDGSERLLVQAVLGVVKRLHRWVGIPVLNWLADRFKEQGLRPASHPTPIYVGVAVWARK